MTLRTHSLPSLNDYAAAVAFANRYKRRATFANNTSVRSMPGDAIAVRLHGTDILTFTPDGVRLNSDRWRTATTKQRMNALLPRRYRVRQTNGAWFIDDRDTGTTFDFADGVVLPY